MGDDHSGGGGPRVRRFVMLAVSVALALAGTLAAAGVAAALVGKVRNWPNSPVRHTLRQTVRATTPTFAANLRGDVAIAGNTLETCPQNIAAARGRRQGKSAPKAAEPCLGANNNDQNMKYVNVDPGDGHFDSSTAALTLPAGARVVRAFLYWGADLARGVNRPPIRPRCSGRREPTDEPCETGDATTGSKGRTRWWTRRRPGAAGSGTASRAGTTSRTDPGLRLSGAGRRHREISGGLRQRPGEHALEPTSLDNGRQRAGRPVTTATAAGTC